MSTSVPRPGSKRGQVRNIQKTCPSYRRGGRSKSIALRQHLIHESVLTGDAALVFGVAQAPVRARRLAAGAPRLAGVGPVQRLLYGRCQRQPQVGLAPPHHERRPFGRGMRPQSHQVLSGVHWLPIHEAHPITSILTIAVIPICACSPVGEVWILSMYCAWVRFPWDHHRASRTTLAPAGTASECRPTAHRTRAATETTPTRPPWDTFRYAPCRHAGMMCSNIKLKELPTCGCILWDLAAGTPAGEGANWTPIPLE